MNIQISLCISRLDKQVNDRVIVKPDVLTQDNICTAIINLKPHKEQWDYLDLYYLSQAKQSYDESTKWLCGVAYIEPNGPEFH